MTVPQIFSAIVGAILCAGSMYVFVLQKTRRFKALFWLAAEKWAGGGLAAYTYTSYMQKYLYNTVGFDKATATYIIAAALLWFTAMQPVFGALADKFGRKPMLLLFGIGGAIVAVPTFMTLEHVTSPYVAALLIMIPLTLQSGYSALSMRLIAVRKITKTLNQMVALVTKQ